MIPLLEQGFIPGGTRRNLDFVTSVVDWEDSADDTTKLLMCDAQTSGGLLISISSELKDELVKKLEDAKSLSSAVIGEIVEYDREDNKRIHLLSC